MNIGNRLRNIITIFIRRDIMEGYYLAFDPPEDITAYELAMFFKDFHQRHNKTHIYAPNKADRDLLLKHRCVRELREDEK
jgi:hypothetical protein